MNGHAVPVGGPIFTRSFKVFFAVFGLSLPVVAWRFFSGIGPTTALNDGYPWGIWIAYDVVSGTALACGGYAVALLCYVLNKGEYHPVVRPAVLTSALGYTLAAVAIVIDVGRYWNLWKAPLLWNWNRNSILLEVAMCVMTYVGVLWIELSPAFLEKWEKEEARPTLSRIARFVRPHLNKAMIWILALGILLPTMHHSSLGALMLISMNKLHRLWHTPMLPLLFLVTCLIMGYAVVIFESAVSSVAFKRARETKMLADLSWVMVFVLAVFLTLRLGDLALRGRLPLVLAGDVQSFFFLVEIALFLAPAILLLPKARRENAGVQFRAAAMMMLAGTLYRFNVYLVGYNPGGGWSYFPSVPEMYITVGLIAFEVMAYVYIVKRYPILGGAAAVAEARGYRT